MSEKRHSVFMGSVREELISVKEGRVAKDSFWCSKPYLDKYNNLKEYKKFYECDLELPPIKHGEELYINELDITITIHKRVRSVNGEDIYYTDYVINTIETSEEEKEKANKKLEKYTKEYEEKIRKINNKKWYQFWK